MMSSGGVKSPLNLLQVSVLWNGDNRYKKIYLGMLLRLMPSSTITMELILGIGWALNGYASLPACNLYHHATEEFHYEFISNVALKKGTEEEEKGPDEIEIILN